MSGKRSDHPSELLASYLDDELPVEERSRIDHHLAECASCRAELDALHLLATAVAAEPVPEPGDDLAARVGAFVDRSMVTPMPARRRWMIPVSVAATVGAVGLLVAYQWRQGSFAPAVPTIPPPEQSRDSASPPPPSPTPEARPQLKGARYAGQPAITDSRSEPLDEARPAVPPPPPPPPATAVGGEGESKEELKKDAGLAAPVSGAAPSDEPARAKSEERREPAADLDRQHANVASPAAISAPTAPMAEAFRDDAKDQAIAKRKVVSFDQPAEGRMYQKTIPLPPGSAPAVVCGDSWVDSGRLAEWTVPDTAAAERDLEGLARGVGGRGAEHRALDGATYVIDVPSGRYDELARGLREKGLTGLDAPVTPLAGAPCVRQRIRVTEGRPGGSAR